MEPLRQGLLGFILYLSHWLSPGTENATLDADFEKFLNRDSAIIRCKMDIGWNEQMEKLVDAGIPLSFKISDYSDGTDSATFYRTLYFNVVNYTYTFEDSTKVKVRRSQVYPMILLALRDFCRWDIVVPRNAANCRVEVHILPGRAEQLDMLVDMSRVWGRQKVSGSFDLRELIPRKRQKSK